jgi:transposase
MRGENENQSYMFSYLSPEERIPKNHPIRKIKELADKALKNLSGTFDKMYSDTGRPSIPPETLLKSQILIALYTVRSDRSFCERLSYDILFQWFLDRSMEAEAFDASVFSKNRERLMEKEIAYCFLNEVIKIARKNDLMSDEHFTADGTLIEAWASMKSFVKKDEKDNRKDDGDKGNPTVDFHGEKRTNETHQSTTDPEALLIRKCKGKEAKLSFCETVLMENRNGLIVDVSLTRARKDAESKETLRMLKKERKRNKRKVKTIAGDKGFCNNKFVRVVKKMKIKPHIAKIEKWKIFGLDGRTIRSIGYAISQKKRKLVEEIFGWKKTVGGQRKTRLKGIERNQEQSSIVSAAYNLIRMSKLISV